ncbi:amino acid kinase [Aureimonas leprariae]|uniref:Amino acid kinase n=1 Tax=Plantimonas leprariae TaxID=2615207 RepID=A0A7V7PNG2_9HYPH|nr:amino acid kinase [Aureimonas leprariae]KAB0679299.1 amino acid kinase [Aureimonas leprariae]
MDNVLVVKLGGSSASSPDFVRWIEAVETAKGKVVVMPGGGPFANTVRRYQHRIGYDEEAVQAMNILAMEQFGFALKSLGTRMVTASDTAALEAAFAADKIPVWLPAVPAFREAAIRTNPDVTSDSIAAWFAGQYANARLLLVKQLDVPANATVETLVHAEMVDPAFLTFLKPQTRVFLAGPNDIALAGKRFSEGAVPGRELRRAGDLLNAAE